MKKYDIVAIFYIIDEIVKKLKKEGTISEKAAGRPSKLTISELITIAIIGHLEEISSQKRLYYRIKSSEFSSHFPKMPCYEQFNSGMLGLDIYMQHTISALATLSQATDADNLKIIDSSPLPISKYPFKYIKWTNDTSSVSKCLDE